MVRPLTVRPFEKEAHEWAKPLAAIVVSHRGTDPESLVEDLEDVLFALVDLDATKFPGRLRSGPGDWGCS